MDAFSLEEVIKHRILKRFWGVCHQEIEVVEDLLKTTGRGFKSIEAAKQVTDAHITTFKT